ncbi:MAG: hypothetical protein ABH858_02845 [Candidatus Omnitrophota bacterium]
MKRIRQILYPLVIALYLIYIQIYYLNIIPAFSPRLIPLNYSLMASAILLGTIFGFIGCPGCGMALTFSLTSFNDKPLSIIRPVITFNAARLIIIFLYAMAGESAFYIAKEYIPIKYIFVLNGIIMIAFAILIGKNFFLKTSRKELNRRRFKNPAILYGLWGLILGFPCAIETTGFLAQLWSYPANYFSKIISLILFTFFSIVPLLLFIALFFFGIKKISQTWQDITGYFRNLAIFYLSLMGIILITYYLP